jgi:hypothetical protein
MNNARARSVVAMTLFAGVGLFEACSGGGTEQVGPPAQSGPVTASAFADAYATALCDAISGCCDDEGLAYDRATCVEAAKDRVETRFVMAVGRAKGVTWNADAAARCIDSLRTSFRSCTANGPSLGDVETACSDVAVGNALPGQACTYAVECAPVKGAVVGCAAGAPSKDGGGGGSAGGGGAGGGGGAPSGSASATCQEVPTPQAAAHANAGDPCNTTCIDDARGQVGGCFGRSGPGGACHASDGLRCSANHVCEALPGAGEACLDGVARCAPGTFCGSSHTCTARAPAGSPCKGPDASFMCEDAAYCDSATSVCTKLKSPGDACKTGLECVSGFCSGKKVCLSGMPYASPAVCGTH